MALLSSRSWYTSSVLATLLLSTWFPAVLSETPPVIIEVHAPWKSTPVQAEASELLAAESNALFWQFAGTFTQDAAADAQIDTFVGANLPPLAVDIFKAELDARAASASVEAILQVSRGRASMMFPKDKKVQAECETAFFEVAETYGCSIDALNTKLSSLEAEAIPSKVYSNDHVYPTSFKNNLRKGNIVILHAAIGTPEFKAMHKVLKEKALGGSIVYVLRHYYTNLPDVPILLPGWGVELDVKKMDYKAVDDAKIDDGEGESDADEVNELSGFNFNTLRQRLPEKSEELKKLKEYLISTRATIRDMKVWELQDIDIQAASRIVRNSNPLKALQHISQNFPVLAETIIKEKVNTTMLAEVRKNQETLSALGLEPGGTLFTMNSRILDPITSDIFSMFEILRADAKMLAAFSHIGFPVDRISQLTAISTTAASGGDVSLDVRNNAINFANDLVKDKRYSRWSKNLMDLLKPSYPGQVRRMSKNLFTAVFAVNPSSISGMQTIVSIMDMIDNDTPVRFGVIFTGGKQTTEGTVYKFTKDGTADSSGADDATEAQVSVALLRCMAYIKKEESVADGFAFLRKVFLQAQHSDDELTIDTVKSIFAAGYGTGASNKLLKSTGNKKSKLQKKGEKALDDLGIVWSDDVKQMFVNGQAITLADLSVETITAALESHMAENIPVLQRALYYGQLPQTADIHDWFCTQPGVSKRLNPLINTLDGPVVAFLGRPQEIVADDVDVAVLSANDLVMSVASDMVYVQQTTEKKVKVSTYWVVANLESHRGQRLAFDALRRHITDKKARVGFVYSGDVKKLEGSVTITRLVYGAIASSGSKTDGLVNQLGKMIEKAMNGVVDVDGLTADIEEADKATIIAAATGDVVQKRLVAHSYLCSKSLSLGVGDNVVIHNGKIIGPIGASDVFSIQDFKALDKLANNGAPSALTSVVARLDQSTLSQSPNDMVMMATAILMASSDAGDDDKTVRRINSKLLSDIVVGESSITSSPDVKDGDFFHHIFAVIDPLSKEAQHLAPILMYLTKITNVKLEIILNPREKVSERPLNRFYRTVLPNVDKTKGTVGAFRNLPTSPILTVGMHVPPAWMVQAKTSPYDLDNIHLDAAPHGVTAIFALEYLMVEGRAFTDGAKPAAGLQLELGTESGGAQFDTIVMANLGYFQLKAAPGAWDMSLRDGRSTEIFRFGKVTGAEENSDAAHPTLILNKFTGKDIAIEVVRNPGKETMQLVESATKDDETTDTATEDLSMWERMQSKLGLETKKEKSAEELAATTTNGRTGETINIFSLASGHLYERFMKLMMLSVLKGTNNPVKFWFLKNCMSPQMQDFLPYFAAEYGFEYALIQYKWPAWLNIPPTRHRQIWGYKILFLDVLFPLDVKKIIFVDADQVVRADMKELVDIDLEGAPYGYTPFCDDRKEMDGFRFWNSGYWKGHLSGRPYHISALYVVDLIRFRQLAAGDRLREQYQGLSRDPNSLSNLDQDLPNNMVHQVPIKSLPQEWLWCETWCSDEIKPKAKTIDLCNNPLTKEPKLEAAVRIVPEWLELDYEAKNMTSRADKLISQNIPAKYNNGRTAQTHTADGNKDEL